MTHDHDHDHDHDADGHHPEPLTEVERRVRALEDLLVEKGIVEHEQIDALVQSFAEDIGPLKGAKVVARAWLDDSFRTRLLDDGASAIAEVGLVGRQDEYLLVVENTETVHNVVVCTLCSCYPWAVLGLPPEWYKSAPYRARVVREPRAVLAEMGCVLDDDVEIRVWDSSAEARYMVLPQRPAGSEGATEEELAAMVTRDSMIGVARL